MARAEGYSEGNVPLHTLRADIDYGDCKKQIQLMVKLGVKFDLVREKSFLKKRKGINNHVDA